MPCLQLHMGTLGGIWSNLVVIKLSDCDFGLVAEHTADAVRTCLMCGARSNAVAALPDLIGLRFERIFEI